MDLAGQEIVNSARAMAYAGAAGLQVECEPCDSLPLANTASKAWIVAG